MSTPPHIPSIPGTIELEDSTASHAQQTIEALVLDHLPSFAGPWAQQYAATVAAAERTTVGLLRVRGGDVTVELIGENPPMMHPADGLCDALQHAAAATTRWIVRFDAPAEFDAATASTVDTATILCGADEMSLISAHRTALLLAEHHKDSARPDGWLRAAIMGAEGVDAEHAQLRLQETGATLPCGGLRIVPGAARIDRIPARLAHHGQYYSEPLAILDTLREAMLASCTKERVLETHEQRVETPVVQTVSPTAQAVSAAPSTVHLATPPLATPPLATPPLATPPLATPPLATPPLATTPIATAHLVSDISPPAPPAPPAPPVPEPTQPAPSPVSQASADDQAPSSPTPSAPSTPRRMPASSPGNEPYLALVPLVKGLGALESRSPYEPEVELAVDQAGQLHALVEGVHALGHAEAAGAWASLHASLLARADGVRIDTSKEPALHVFVRKAGPARALLDADVRIRLLQEVHAGGQTVTIAVPLNGPEAD